MDIHVNFPRILVSASENNKLTFYCQKVKKKNCFNYEKSEKFSVDSDCKLGWSCRKWHRYLYSSQKLEHAFRKYYFWFKKWCFIVITWYEDQKFLLDGIELFFIVPITKQLASFNLFALMKSVLFFHSS